jgi:hypothetical protein
VSPLAWPIAAGLSLFRGRFDLGDVPPVAEIDRALSERAGVRFVEAPPRGRRRGALDRATLYDARIVSRREVPTRNGNLHDFMNALVWASFARSKMAIHERQHALIESRIEGDRLPAQRTPEQDTLAMVDEGGIVLVTSETSLVEQVTQNRDGEGLGRLVHERRATAAVFGHALFEHLAQKRPGMIWGRAVILRGPLEPAPAEIDALLADAVRLREADYDAGSAPLVPSVLLPNVPR